MLQLQQQGEFKELEAELTVFDGAIKD